MRGKDSAILKEKRGTLAECWPQYLLAFLFPTLTVLAAFAVTGCYPFGERTILTVDLYHQYCPFLVAFRDKFWAGESLFYSWNDGLGQEYFAAYANYAASPLNIFAIFFTAKTMPIFIALITCIRAGLSSIFMLKFLSANDNRRIDNITVIFAASYALCGWYISFFWNIMWCDGVVLLPLIMLGLRKLFLDRRWGLYTVSLAIAIISNYYAGYFICLFLVFFAPCYYVCVFSREKPKGDPQRLCVKTFFGSAIRFAVASLLAAAASAAVTIPTYLILQHCSATGNEFKPDYNLQTSLFDFFGRLMVVANPNIRDGMANVYSGLVIVLLLPLFFMLPSKTGIKLKHKIVFGLLLFIMYLSFTNRSLNFIWHGFHFPNQIPYRESFLMSFLLVFVGFLTIRRIRALGAKYVTGAVLSSAAFLVLFEKFGTGNEGYIQIGATLLFLIIQGAALHTVSNTNSKKSEFFCETLLTVTMMVEMFAATLSTIGLVAVHEGFTSYAPYGKNKDEVAAYAATVEGTEGHMNFERSELFPNNVCDLQSLYDVKGLSIFSSTARENFVRYMRNFGFHNNNINGLRNSGLTRVTATLLCVRNLIETDKTQAVPAVFSKEYSNDVITSWANYDALSVGYMVDPEVLGYEPNYDDPNTFTKTNTWLNRMGAGDVYKPVSLNVLASTGMSTSDNNSSCLVYNAANNAKDYVITLSVTEADLGSDVYVYINAKKGGTVVITNGTSRQEFEIRSYQIITLGVYNGAPIEVTVKYHEQPGSSIFVYGYQLDQEGYQNMLSVLGDEQLEVTSYDATSISGHIDVIEDGLLFLTIPYAEGWTAEVDGKEAEIVPVQDALMGIMLEKGSHDITLKYTPAGFKEGLAISSAAIVVIIAVSAVSVVLDKNRKKKALAAASAVTPAAVPEASEGELIEEVPVSEILTESPAPADETVPATADEEVPVVADVKVPETAAEETPSVADADSSKTDSSEEHSQAEESSEDQPEEPGDTSKPEADND